MSSNSDEVFENPYCQRPGDDDIPVPGVLDLQWMWQPGDEITVKFLNGTDTARNEVKEHAVKWTGSGAANLTFNFVSDDKDALVRVKFDTGMNITRGLGTGSCGLFVELGIHLACWRNEGEIVRVTELYLLVSESFDDPNDNGGKNDDGDDERDELGDAKQIKEAPNDQNNN